MKLSELKPNAVFKVTGGEGGYWLYTGLHQANMTCRFCHKVRASTHEFLHYKSLEDLRQNFGSFDWNDQFGSECVKAFIADILPEELIGFWDYEQNKLLTGGQP